MLAQEVNVICVHDILDLRVMLEAVAMQVLVNDHVSKALTLVNAGSLRYEYNWRLGGSPRLAVTPSTGSVGAGERLVCTLSFSPTSVQQLNQHKVICQVVNGRTYTLMLSGVPPPATAHSLSRFTLLYKTGLCSQLSSHTARHACTHITQGELDSCC